MAYEKGLILIPARYGSHRLPGKALADISGKTMIRRTYERCKLTDMHVMVVTDDKRIVDECLTHSIPVDIVTAECKTGTDRVARCAERNPSQIGLSMYKVMVPTNPDDILRAIHQMENGDHREG